ncbi:MAG: SnoaL-like domain-containing protein [Ferruginibacter sp.]
MSINEIAIRLTQLCREGQFETAQKEFFADDAVSIEPEASPAFEKETKGLPAILEKGHKFESMVETMHSITASEPLVADNSFCITMRLNAVMKGHGPMDVTELCVYKVKDGKIISEEFFM